MKPDSSSQSRILVLGGYGHFGARICRGLVKREVAEVIVAGRDPARAEALVRDLCGKYPSRTITALPLDHCAPDLRNRLFEARLSSSIVTRLSMSMTAVRGIEISISPANHTPRGRGTIAAVLSYCGRPFTTLKGGVWQRSYGWQDIKRVHYPDCKRWASACDVPDLEILAARYPAVETVTFHAGLELGWQQWALWSMAWLRRCGLVRDWARYASAFERLNRHFASWGTDTGGMHVSVWGDEAAGNRVRRMFYLTARQNHGPEIPCIPAIVLAEALVTGRLQRRGAMPCLDLLSLDDFSGAAADFDISWIVVDEGSVT